MKPGLIFDKSFLQSFSVDEAVMLDQMFSCLITPVFFVETMSNLAKDANRSKTPEQIVGNLAEKTPVSNSHVNTYHGQIILQELMGRGESIDYRPAMAGGIPVKLEGKPGVVYKESPERQAFKRWQKGQFLELERDFARAWRKNLQLNRLPFMANSLRQVMRKEDRPKNHLQARQIARDFIDRPGRTHHLIKLAGEMFELPDQVRRFSSAVWKESGAPPLRLYAPLTSHCIEVEVFFQLCLSNGLISDQRPSN